MGKPSFGSHKGRADGTGQASIREKSREESVMGEANSNVPGGESKKGKHIETQGGGKDK